MENFEIYLNDHLAGSVAGLEIIQDLIEKLSASPHGPTLQQLKTEIESERDQLLSIMKRLNMEVSSFRRAAAWLTEKGVELKLRFDDPSGGPMLIFESLEALSIGVTGKGLLWRTLENVADEYPELDAANLQGLVGAAERQQKTIEEIRIQAARGAFIDGGQNGR